MLKMQWLEIWSMRIEIFLNDQARLFFFIFVFTTNGQQFICSIKIAGDWIRTRVLWYRKRLRCQLWHNNCPGLKYFSEMWSLFSIIKRAFLMFPFRYFLDSQKSFYNIDHGLEGLFSVLVPGSLGMSTFRDNTTSAGECTVFSKRCLASFMGNPHE